MTSKAAPLLAMIKKQFYPFAETRGFVRAKSENPLFTTFHRTVGNQVQMFEIQWDKYWRPCFVVNFGGGSASNEQINYEGRLQRRRGGSQLCWFGIRRPWLSKLLSGKWKYTPEEVVIELIAAFDEMETWWAEGTEGPHIKRWGSNKQCHATTRDDA